MSSAVVLDGRCESLRRQLGPAAWMILEEAALSAVESEGGPLWAPLSIRSASEATGQGRESVGRAIGGLVSAGLLRRAEARRTPGGRFQSGGYWLTPPAGLAVSPVSDRTVPGEPAAGAPRPVLPAVVATEEQLGTKESRGGGGGRRRREFVQAEQPSLFGPVAEREDQAVEAEGTPGAGEEPVGAVSSVGCEVDNRVHELAPGVPPGAGPGVDPHPVEEGGDRC